MSVTTLYHYCSIEAFVSIISSRTIRLSLLNQSNDAEEGRWILRFLKQQIEQNQELARKKDTLFDIIENAAKVLDFAGFCLSEEGDILSQWRGYADNGQGVSIGFNKAYLEKLDGSIPREGSGINLSQVIYGNPDLDQGDINFYKEFLSRAKDFSKFNPNLLFMMVDEEQKKNYRQANSSLYISLIPIILFSYQYKNPAFSEEREWRLTNAMLSKEGDWSVGSLCEFRSAGNRLVPYRSVPLEATDEKAIETVVLGPRNHSLAEHVSAMLQKYGFEDVEVIRSSATYR